MTKASEAIALLNLQYQCFLDSEPFAIRTKHPVPMDTRSWSQILVSLLTGVAGADQKKGADFSDGSDVKGANCWKAIDTPRFNGVIKAGTKAESSGSIQSLDKMPYLFFVLWDTSPSTARPRCRIWVVRPKHDQAFRRICTSWYENAKSGKIRSTNFQLHPPRNSDKNMFTNTCGDLDYPLFFCAEYSGGTFYVLTHDERTLKDGNCTVPERS